MKKSKLRYLTLSSLKKKLKSKWFIVVNIIMFLCIPLLCNIDNIIKAFGGDFLEPTKIIVVDNTGETYNTFKKTFNDTNKFVLKQSDIKVEKSDRRVVNLSKKMKEDKSKDVIIEINKDDKKLFNATVTSYDNVDSFLYQNIVNALNTTKSSIALNNSNIDKNELASVYEQINIERTYLKKDVDKNSDMMKMIGNVALPIFIIPFFFLIIIVVQMIGSEINDEKTSKSMEVIISSVSPKIHFISKMIAVNVFVIFQSLLLFVYGAVGVFLRMFSAKGSFVDSFSGNTGEMIKQFLNSSMFGDILSALPFTIVLFVLSFIAYSLVAGILASVTTSIEDYSQIQTPLMLVLLLGYYLAIIASMYESSVLIKAAAFVPFLSAIVAPVLLVLGQISIVHVLISTLIMVVTIWLLVKYGLRIYKVGILNYSSNKLWRKMFKAAKQKE